MEFFSRKSSPRRKALLLVMRILRISALDATSSFSCSRPAIKFSPFFSKVRRSNSGFVAIKLLGESALII
ncbi:Uncharacterised protein [Vibrio cholerae]|nr:Uncharacterised protein [Vibrio cholerae]